MDTDDMATAMPRLDAWLGLAERLIEQYPPTLQCKGLIA